MRLAIKNLARQDLVAAIHVLVSRWYVGVRIVTVILCAQIVTSCAVEYGSIGATEAPQAAIASARVDDFIVGDCLLPGQIRQLGQKIVYVGRRRPIQTTAVDCGIRGGEYVAYDRADYGTARKVWLAEAEGGDHKAQNYLGEIYEKGLGTDPDFNRAAEWYRKAAEQGYAAAQMNLGKLYESGRGVPQDMGKALYWYQQASGLEQLAPVPALQPAPASAAVPIKPTGIEVAESAGPTIEMIEPIVPETRGIVLIPADHEISERLIVGRVRASAGLLALTVNDKDISLESNEMFRTHVPVRGSGSKVKIVAIDKTGRRAVREFRLQPSEPVVPQQGFGNYHALVIGNNNYKILNSLTTARSDAQTIAEILRKKYGFTITTLYDADRYQILATLNQLRKRLTEDDNLLIYYAGHGELDKANDRGYWLPIDAEHDSTANWISNIQLTDILNIMSAKHILVVADSCYSGTLTRSVQTQLRPGQSDAERAIYYQTVIKKRSRTALTSGGLKPVLDAGSKGHSVFANAFIDSLRSNAGVLEGQRLFLDVVARVTQAAYDRRFEQVPQYAPIKFAGHEAGDFFFIPGTTRAGELPAVDVATPHFPNPGGRLAPGLTLGVSTRISSLRVPFHGSLLDPVRSSISSINARMKLINSWL